MKIDAHSSTCTIRQYPVTTERANEYIKWAALCCCDWMTGWLGDAAAHLHGSRIYSTNSMVLPRTIWMCGSSAFSICIQIYQHAISRCVLYCVWCEFALSNDTEVSCGPPSIVLSWRVVVNICIWYSYPLSHERFCVEIVCFYALFTMSKHALSGEALMRELSMVLYLL